MMCNCQTMARDMSETHDGRFPPSRHAPRCEDFKRFEFSRITCNMGRFVVPADEQAVVCENLDEPYQVETVMLTQDQFDNLPEYDG